MPSVIPASTLINSSISNDMMNSPTNLRPTDSSVPSSEGVASKHDSQLMQHMFRAFVGKALDDKSSGNVAAYEDMRRQFSIRPDSKDAPSSVQIQNLLSALTCNVSRLDSSCSSLITSILGSVWVSRDESFVRCYTKFLGHLLSAQSTYMPLVMTMLIQHMCYQSNSLAIHYEHAHMALKYVLDLVPRAHSYLYSCILEEFPYKDESILAQMTYISNVLSICEYVPSLKGPVLHAVIDKIIQVDVEIQVELDIEDDEDSDSSDDAASDVLTASALYERHAGASEDLTASTLLNDDPLSPVDTKQTLLQLDQLLYTLFSYLSKNLNQSRDRYVVYNSLIRSFVNTVLKTFRCRYTQFLIFWASQLNPEFTDIFLGVLTEVCLDPSQPYTLRISGAMYLGSYVARAKTLEASTIQIIVGLMTRWMEAYLDQCENELSDDLISKHSVFYAINQSVLYIYCFRWQELRISDETDPMDPKPAEWLPGLEVLHRSVLSRLNPLRYCSPNIVHQFARIANHLNFMYVYSILEQNRKGSIRDGLETIDSFFPFDPYRLSKSSSIVQPFYNEWRPVPGMDDMDEAEDEPVSDYPLVSSL
ncbi:ribosomal DNA transcription factor Rrn3 [Schizosaccharomyces octosporus yFS286]|uniref:Ribosomal DNA transcription factor Rrn3 n=1 Tax=Schizosaccharomyces octosporus (strain yFS286) TaxID=483514 RepID=S9R955_SCHOY|nr:ribosomal DNA transcription factor Rrn3 [Schizosaccharomyces octosporus yFS286]EPX70629.1 ribosomal DNA transcription factor Rrn3 [Schizosaccharomyces octosporus yFS286]